MTDRIKGRTITITGGTGSFGKTMAMALLDRGAERVNIFSRDEAKQDDMRRRLSDERLRFFLGDVRDRESIEPAMQGVDYVFHAAALKQVPSCEFFPHQAVLTNVIGSTNVIESAAAAGVRSVVCLSTDKAVYPINAMGMTKALMEKAAQAWARNHPDADMTISITRYGNVLYSRGSVVPMFVDQIRRGEPMTVTEPTMTRFYMTLQESVDLVEYAWEKGVSGDIFVMKSPASTVEVLARGMATIMGKPDHPIRVIGIRHGEKMHEALLGAEEVIKADDMNGFFRVPLDARGLQYELYFDEGQKSALEPEGFTSENAEQLDVEGVMEFLLHVPQIKALADEAAAARRG